MHQTKITSKDDIYDIIAPHYQDYAEKRKEYIYAVNNIVTEFAPKPTQSMLDVGSGDGSRAYSLSKSLKTSSLTLTEPSAEMVKLCKKHSGAEVIQCTANNLPQNKQYDLITCLWNVMGHMPDRNARVAGLTRMMRCLNSNGRIVLDVNNRHNALAYGHLKVSGRRFLDGLFPDDKRGDASFFWDINGEKIPATGHLFIPQEMKQIITKAGLQLTQSFAVDYKNGQRNNDLTKGQMVFVLKK